MVTMLYVDILGKRDMVFPKVTSDVGVSRYNRVRFLLSDALRTYASRF